MASPSVYIYIPQQFWPRELPTDPNENWPGFGLGMYTWTIQTYLRLKAIAFPCRLVNELPEKGIILVDHNHLRATRLRPSQRQLLICLKQDGLPYPYAQLHVVQNFREAQTKPHYHYISHWPQPGLIRRDPGRGDRFENVAFFGHRINLARELQQVDWPLTLAAMGLNWCPILNQNHWSKYRNLDARWHDYSHIDAVLAVRTFGTKHSFLHKPATKLYNAWLAHVPAILGYESAFRCEGRPGFNYLEATTRDALLQNLQQLKTNLDLRKTLVDRGALEAQHFTADKTVQRWRSFLELEAIPAYETWCRKSRHLQLTILRTNWLRYKTERGVARLMRSAAIS